MLVTEEEGEVRALSLSALDEGKEVKEVATCMGEGKFTKDSSITGQHFVFKIRSLSCVDYIFPRYQ